MTDEEKMVLAELKNREIILSFSYWENFKYAKELAQGLGGSHPKVRSITADCEKIREDWNASEHAVKEFLKTIKKDKETD